MTIPGNNSCFRNVPRTLQVKTLIQTSCELRDLNMALARFDNGFNGL